jgi:cytochrome P450
MRRIARRIILGDQAREDEELTDRLFAMMEEANSMPGEPADELGEFRARLRAHIDRADPGSLASLVANAPQGEHVDPTSQFTHWLFAMGDTLATNAFRALAALAAHPTECELALGEVDRQRQSGELNGAAIVGLQRLRASMHEAMRLWPTTPILSRELIAEAKLGGHPIPAGTQVVIVNTYLHRERDRHPEADRFHPDNWITGPAPNDWSFNHLSHGPQGCPGSDLVLFIGAGLIAQLLAGCEVRLVNPQLDAGRPLPHMLDPFTLRFELSPRR